MMGASTIVLAALAAFGGAAQAPAAGQPDYMPLKLGTKWTYDIDGGDGVKNRVSQQVAKIETIDGAELARLDLSANGNVAATEHVRATPEGLLRHRLQGLEYEPAVVYLKLPYKEGESWEQETKVGNQTVKSKFTAGPVEEVTTPAGTFKAIAVKSSVTVQGNELNATNWYAENVGVVKMEMKIGDRVIKQELVEFEPAK